MEIFKHNFFRTPLFLVAIAIMTIFLILGVLFSLGDVSKVLADENNLASSVYDGVSPEGPIMNPSPIPCTGGEDAALIQDNVPWFAPTDQDPLGANITELKAQNIDFCVINSSEVGTVNLSQFPEIIISAAQVQSFYNNIFTGGTAHSALTNYVQNGGILSANLTDNASGPGAGGNWDGRTFIGGLTHVHNSLNDNAISAPNHPIITGQFGGTNGGLVVDTGQFQDLDGWNSSSHGFFTNLPPNTTNIIVDSLNRPIMIEYSFGSGKVIASQVTNEWRYVGNFGGLPQNKKLLANEIGYQRSLAGPEDEVLDVRYFDQADSRWAIEEYDTASEWIPSVVNTTISRWGCMLSSVAMVLQYHGITTLPNCTSNMCTDLEGLEVNPSNLNQWLLREPGGYYSGFVNLYTAIDKLSDFADKPLIYEKFNGWDEEVLEDEIKNERPAIIELGDPGIGHFAVATGILFSENTFSLNDPDRDYATKLSTYGDTHTSIRKITPTNTDFSTIFISISPPLDFVFMDEQGRRTGFDPVTQEVVQEIPGALYSFLAPLTDDNKTGATNGDGATQLDFNLPAEGEYMLQIHEPEETEEYNLAFYVLGKDADAVFVEDSNTATPDFGQTYSINYFPGEPFPAKVDLIVDIDIKPESATNPINCSNSNGIIPLAILSDDGFDATTIDPNTVRFGPLGVEEFHRNKDGSARQHLEDVDNDGDLDLVLHFTLGGSGLTCEDVVVGLSGTTFTGLGISGSDNVRMIEGGWFFLSSVLNWINHWALFR